MTYKSGEIAWSLLGKESSSPRNQRQRTLFEYLGGMKLLNDCVIS